MLSYHVILLSVSGSFLTVVFFMVAVVCSAFEAEEGSQVQALLEHLPPFCGIHCDHPKHCKHL